MNHCGTKTLETERLILRRFQKSDSEAVYKNWTSDDKVTEFLRWPTHRDISVTENVINDWVVKYSEPNFYQWAIVLKEINEPIGTITVVGINDRLDIAHVGYCIGSKWWRQGITSEAYKSVISFLFNEVGANRIESQHDPNNPNSGRVMKKCGLTYEGTMRQADFSNKGTVDVAMYSILRSEWKND